MESERKTGVGKPVGSLFHILLMTLVNPLTYVFAVISLGLVFGINSCSTSRYNQSGFSRGLMSVAVFIGGLTLSALILLIVREIVCWYFKYNRVVELLEEISRKLEPAPPSQAPGRSHGGNVNVPASEPDGSGMS